MMKLLNGILSFFTITCLSLSSVMVTAIVAPKNDNRFLGKRIYIDPGHGGKDNGANYEDILEDELNLKVGLELYEQLVYSGATVAISRVGDYDLASLYASNRKREDLAKRLANMKLFQPDIFLSIHMNIYSSSSVYGGQVFYRQGDQLSKMLAQDLQTELNQLNSTKKNVKSADFYFFNRSDLIGVLVECGFISSAIDRAKLTSSEYRKQFSLALLNGTYNFLSKNI